MTFEEKIYDAEREDFETGYKKGYEEGLCVGTSVWTYFKVGKTAEEVIDNIAEDYSLSRDDAERYVNKFVSMLREYYESGKIHS